MPELRVCYDLAPSDTQTVTEAEKLRAAAAFLRWAAREPVLAARVTHCHVRFAYRIVHDDFLRRIDFLVKNG